jgi:glycyl-tRNA synthetase beta chain
VGEVFKRAQNIAKDAKPGAPVTPSSVGKDVHASEQALFDAFGQLDGVLGRARKDGDYGRVLSAISEFAPVLGRFFTDVFVMTDDLAVRENRLRMMSAIHSACSAFASFNLLGKAAS